MTNTKSYTTIKIVLIVLLLLCLLQLPYGLYQLFRVIFTVGFVLLAIKANEDKKQTELTIYIVLAVLFQPLLKISLGREIWNILDIVVALGLIVNLFKTSKNETRANS